MTRTEVLNAGSPYSSVMMPLMTPARGSRSSRFSIFCPAARRNGVPAAVNPDFRAPNTMSRYTGFVADTM